MRTPYEVTKDKFLTDEELKHLRANLKTATNFNRTLIETLLHTGARAKEVLNITVQDLNLADRSVMIRGLKGSADRELPFPPKLFARLRGLASTDPIGRVFPISYPRLYQIWKFHQPTKGPHSARHTLGIQLYRKHKDLQLVKTVLGHRSVSNTMIYSNYVFSQAQLRKLIL